MPNWLKRYKQGEHAAVWAEMEALGAGIRSRENLPEARKVAKETMLRALENVESLIAALSAIGYRFAAPGGSSMTWAMELRLSNAVEYAKSAGKKYTKDPWSHPALAWVEVEEPPVAEHYLEGRAAWTVHRKPPAGIAATLDGLEPLSLSLRAFWEIVGSVDLAGSHPLLNRDASIASLKVASHRKSGPASPDSTAGAALVADLRRAFAWGGFPGWEGHPDPPTRELEFLKSKLSAL